jgi:F420-0:gamma-glutamyl ligase-like protein
MLFGGADGYIYKLDASVATDNGVEFSSIVIGKSMVQDSLQNLNILQIMVDYENIIAGDGYFGFALNRAETAERLFTFPIVSGRLRIAEYTLEINSYAEDFFSTSPFGRANSFEQTNGEVLAPAVVIVRGAAVINEVLLRIGNYGRAAA